jgi:histone H3/H4
MMDESTDTESTATDEVGRNKRKAPKWLREVRHYQSTTELLFPRQPFRRLVREVAQDWKTDVRFTEESFEAIQTASDRLLDQAF